MGCCERSDPLPQASEVEGQYLSQPQQVRSGCAGAIGNFFATPNILAIRRGHGFALHHGRMNEQLLWVLSVGLILVGLAGIVLPALPGTAFILGGIVLGAWIDNFTKVGVFTVSVVAVLAVLSWAMDYVAAALGAKRAGASRLAIVGAAVGTVVGIFMGIVGVLFMPLVGAAVGEFIARRNHGQAVRVGIATWLGLLAGMLAKFVLAFAMIGIFVAALLW
jgi:uncharacterized protein YqgC (DUF456 family)